MFAVGNLYDFINHLSATRK